MASLVSRSFLHRAWLLGVVGAALVVWSCATGKAPPTCDPGQSLCGTTCIDPQNDPDNCGKCGNACPLAQVCSSGQCAQECPSGVSTG